MNRNQLRKEALSLGCKMRMAHPTWLAYHQENLQYIGRREGRRYSLGNHTARLSCGVFAVEAGISCSEADTNSILSSTHIVRTSRRIASSPSGLSVAFQNLGSATTNQRMAGTKNTSGVEEAIRTCTAPLPMYVQLGIITVGK